MEPTELARLLESVQEGLLAVDAAGGLTYVNGAARRLLDLPDGVPLASWYSGVPLYHRHGCAPLVADDFAPNRCARLREPVEQVVVLRGGDGRTVRQLHVRAWPADGTTAAVAVAIVRSVDASDCHGCATSRVASYVDLLRLVAAATNQAGELDEALTVALRAVCETSSWNVGQVHLVEEFPPRFVDGGAAYYTDPARYRPFRDATERISLGLSDGLPGRVRARRAPVFVADTGTEADLPRIAGAREAGLHVGFGFPILVRDEVVGVVELYAEDRAPPEPELLDALVQVGTLLGRAIERERARTREAFFRAVIDNVGDPIFVKDRSLRWVLLNRAHEEWIGIPRDAMIGKSDPDFFPPEQAAFFHAKDREMFASGSRVSVEEEPITDGSGNVHWLTTTKVPLRSPSGEVTHLVGIIHDITRLKSAEADLKQRNEQLAAEVRHHAAAEERLRAANRELEGFCWSVSHDLRTPLRAIDGFSSVLLDEHSAQLDATGLEALGRIRRNVHRMAQLIDDLLELSRVARAPVNRQVVDLAALGHEIIEEWHRREPFRRVSFTATSDLVACADPRLARLLLDNVLGNAWKFTSHRPEARIELCRSGDAYYVRDNGAGFEMSHSAMLFKPFCRLHRDEEFPGTGVGLATVERIVERHGGRVWAEGKPDVGATVWFTFGAAACPVPEPAIARGSGA